MGFLLTRSEPSDVASSAAGDAPQALHYASWDRVRSSMSPTNVIDVVQQAGLTGKGGAGFPTHRKMRFMQAQPGPRKIVVLNGSEHEPGSLKDRHLMEHYPHTVLEGALILAYAAQATEVIVAVNRVSPACSQQLQNAFEVAKQAGIDFGSVSVQIVGVPDTYIVGEETALLEVIEGRQALPKKKPPFPIEAGAFNAPTLIQNIETAAHLPLIFSAGAAAYRALGVNGKGLTLCTLGEEFNHAGVHEVPLGTPIRAVLEQWGGGLRSGLPIKAIQPGGPSSGFVQEKDFDLPLDAEVLQQHGAALGCAAIHAYSTQACMVEAIAAIMSFFAHGSCGQCPRCRMETNMLDTIMRRVLSGGGNWQLLAQIDKLIELAKGEGKCSLIDMPVAPIRTGLAMFRDEFAAHVEGTCQVCAARMAPAVGAK